MIILFGKDLRKSLVQFPAPSKVSYEARRGSQGFVQFNLENLKGWRILLLSCAPLLDSSHSLKKKKITFINSDPSCFELHTIYCPSAIYCCEKLGSIFSTLFIAIARLPLGTPQSLLFTRLKVLSVLSLSGSLLRMWNESKNINRRNQELWNESDSL